MTIILSDRILEQTCLYNYLLGFVLSFISCFPFYNRF